MNENKKTLIVIGIVGLLILMVIFLAIYESKKSEKLYNNFIDAFNGSENTLVYIGKANCNYCNLLNPSLDDMTERYNFSYIYINTESMAKKYMSQVMGKLGVTSVGTPYLAIVSNGKVVDIQDGYSDYDITFKFLQKNDIIKEDSKLLLNYIGLDEYKTLLNDTEKHIIVVGQSTCTYCVHAKVILNDIADENNITINYLNVSYLSNEEGQTFESSLDYFQNDWGTPVMFISKEGKMVDVLEGLTTKENYISFLKNNGVLQ